MNVAKFRSMAEKLRSDAELKLKDRDTHTQKKLGQARTSEREGRRQQRAASLIDKFCDAAEANDLPPILAGAKLNKQDFLNAVNFAGVHISNGYHSYLVDSREYSSKEPLHVALRCLLEQKKTAEEIAAEKEQHRQAELKRKIDGLRHSNIPGFFPTPAPVIAQMLDLAEIEAEHRVLEPSAGLGDIVDAIKANGFSGFLDAIELNSQLCAILGLKGHHHQQFDFLEWRGTKYDRVIMNPPFERKQGIAHIQHAYSLLRPGGRIVAILPPNHAAELDYEEITIEQIDDGAFAGREAFRRTGVSTVIVVIDKPAQPQPITFAAPAEQPRAQRQQLCLFN